MKKRLTVLVLCVLMLLTLAPAAFAEEDGIIASGVTAVNDRISWTIDKNGVLTFTGSGELKGTNNFGNDFPGLREHIDKVTAVVIDGEITKVSQLMLYRHSIKTLRIGDSVRELGANAFYDCSGIKTVFIGDGVEAARTDAKKTVSNAEAKINELVAEYINKATNEINLRIYYCTRNTTDLKLLCADTFYKSNTCDVPAAKDDEFKYTPSFMILAPEEIFVYVYQEGTSKAATATYNGCNWNNYQSDLPLLARVSDYQQKARAAADGAGNGRGGDGGAGEEV